MTDYTELQAELAAKKSAGWQCTDGLSIDTVLALIGESQRLSAENKQLILLECHGGTAEAAINLLAERDQLKAENGAAQTLIGSVVIAAGARLGKDLVEVIELLRKDAERYRWLREARHGCIEVVEWIGPHATGMTGEDLDALLDAAIGKGEQS